MAPQDDVVSLVVQNHIRQEVSILVYSFKVNLGIHCCEFICVRSVHIFEISTHSSKE